MNNYKFAILSVLVGALLMISCSSKLKTADDQLDKNIDTNPLSSDQLGSDSGKIPGLSSIQFTYDSATLTENALTGREFLYQYQSS